MGLIEDGGGEAVGLSWYGERGRGKGNAKGEGGRGKEEIYRGEMTTGNLKNLLLHQACVFWCPSNGG